MCVVCVQAQLCLPAWLCVFRVVSQSLTVSHGLSIVLSVLCVCKLVSTCLALYVIQNCEPDFDNVARFVSSLMCVV